MTTDNLPTALREWRERIGYSREQAAARLGVSFSTYLRWERGKTPRALASLAAIRRELGGQQTAGE